MKKTEQIKTKRSSVCVEGSRQLNEQERQFIASFLCSVEKTGYSLQSEDKIIQADTRLCEALSVLKSQIPLLKKSLESLAIETDRYEFVGEIPKGFSFLDAIAVLSKTEDDENIEIPEIKKLGKSAENMMALLIPEQQAHDPKAVDKESKKHAEHGINTLLERIFPAIPIGKANTNKESGTEERYVLGVVLEPTDGSDGFDVKPDTDGEIYSADAVRKAAHWYMEHGPKQHGLLHGDQRYGGEIFPIGSDKVVLLENYVTPIPIPENTFGNGSPEIKAGTWLMGLRINDDELWAQAKSKELNGLSIGGVARAYTVDSEENTNE